jgi:hypothetical protein
VLCLRFNLLKRALLDLVHNLLKSALLDLVHCGAFVGAELTNFALPLQKKNEVVNECTRPVSIR